jgi:hypothetical protein
LWVGTAGRNGERSPLFRHFGVFWWWLGLVENLKLFLDLTRFVGLKLFGFKSLDLRMFVDFKMLMLFKNSI